MELWVCGQRADYGDTKEWEFIGVYDTEALAAACVTNLFFIAPATLNKSFPTEPVPWLGAYYPRSKF